MTIGTVRRTQTAVATTLRPWYLALAMRVYAAAGRLDLTRRAAAQAARDDGTGPTACS